MEQQRRGRIMRGGLAVCCIAAAGAFYTANAGGLPHQYLLSIQWRNLFFAHSPLTNPAFQTDENYPSARGAFSFAPDQVGQLWEAGYLQPIGLYQTLGFSWVGESDQPVISETLDMHDTTFRTIGEFQNTNTCLMLSYAVNPWRQLSLGVNVKYLQQSNFGDPITQIAVDAGVAYRLMNHPALGYHVLGAAYHNALVFDPVSGGDSIIMMGEGAQLKAQYYSALFSNVLTLNCQFGISDLMAKSSEFLSGSPALEWDLLLQAGVWLLRVFDFKGFFGLSDEGEGAGPRYWGLGLGFNLPSINAGRDVEALYQFRDEIAGGKVRGELRLSHSVYVRVEMGQHREEVYARRMARLMNMTPNELYNRAMTLYHQGKYWDAYIIYARINSDFPDFFKDDWVLHYMGACLERLDMRDAGVKSYQEAKTVYPASDAVPYTDLGLMRIFYRNADFGAVSEQYRLITAAEGDYAAPDSIVNHARYIMGQTCIRQKLYSDAIQLLARVPEGHPDYLFAQHSLAVAYTLADASTATVLNFFSHCLGGTPVTPAQREIINRTWLFVGYIYYEQDTLSKAVKSLRNIPAQSAYYSEAMLGLAWVAVKAQQWADCITHSRELQNTAVDPLLKAEGMLLEAYARIYQKELSKAAAVLDEAQKIIESYNPPDHDTLLLRNLDYGDLRNEYNALSDAFIDAARRGQPGSSLVKRLDDLHGPQTALKEKIDAHLRFIDKYQRIQLFGKNLPALKSDIGYARAIVGKLLGTQGTRKTLEEDKAKQEKLDAEIGKLKEELEKLKRPQ